MDGDDALGVEFMTTYTLRFYGFTDYLIVWCKLKRVPRHMCVYSYRADTGALKYTQPKPLQPDSGAL